MNNIANKSIQRNITEENEQLTNIIEQWKNCLTEPQKVTKVLFKNTYIDNANVLGATCSSIAETTSEGKRASFAWTYLSIFNRKEMEDIKNEQQDSKENRSEAYWSAFDKTKNTKFNFDVVIMDEASKVTPPEFGLPLLYGKKAIIIGDHRQLPPMLDENDFATTLTMIGERELAREFKKQDHNISHFEKLFLNPNINSNIRASFDTQYRMHPQINEVIKQFYINDNGLSCGLDIKQVDDENLSNPVSRYHGFNHEGFICPNTHVIWVNVDTPELLEGTSRVNFGEIDACRKVLDLLYHSEGFETFQNHWTKPEDKEIGLISFYGRQLFHLEQMSRSLENKIPIRIRTVDRFQGMERNIVMVSMVRSNKIASHKEQEADYELYGDLGFPKQNSLGFAEFPNRLNVALSRAKRLLIIVGNAEHFCRHEVYKNVYQTIKNSKFDRIIDYKDLKQY
jgi:superfamily I DNA and/or RNA helicase